MFLGMNPLDGPVLDPAYAALAQNPLMTTEFHMPSVSGKVASQGFQLRNVALVAVVFRVDVHEGGLHWCSFRSPAFPVGSCLVVSGAVGQVQSGTVRPSSWGWDQGTLRVDWGNPGLPAGGTSVGFAVVASGHVAQQFFAVNGEMPQDFRYPVIYGIQ
jgi:hypothetical protein